MHGCVHMAYWTSLSTVGMGRVSDILGDKVGGSDVLAEQGHPLHWDTALCMQKALVKAVLAQAGMCELQALDYLTSLLSPGLVGTMDW